MNSSGNANPEIIREDGNLMLSGLTIFAGYVLEQNSNLSRTNCTTYGGMITTHGGDWNVTITATVGNTFYRLRQV